jgi:hemolysin D
LAPQVRGLAISREFLPAALEIMDTPASPAARYTATALAAFFSIALGWSIIGRVDIIATAPGTVIPVGKSKIVQSLEAGIVSAILVEDGAHVKAGQPVVVLDSTETATGCERLARDLRQARLDVAGLTTLKRDIATGSGLASFVAPPDTPAREADLQLLAISARRQEQAGKLADLMQQIAAKVGENTENAAAMTRLRASLPYVVQKRDMYRALRRDQLAPVPAWADAEQASAEQQQQIGVFGQHTATIDAQRASLVQQLAEARATYAHDVLKDLSDAEQKDGELTQEYIAAVRKAQETVLRAPIAGTVQELAVHTVGGVVTAAQALLKVVPDQGAVLIEATVENKDVGFVHAGQDVEVKVDTFTFTRYGLLHGRVLDVSRDAATTPSPHPPAPSDGDNTADDSAGDTKRYANASGYVAHVALDRSSLDVDGEARTLEPGMSVTAEIKTGRRTVMSYLLSPLARYRAETGGER